MEIWWGSEGRHVGSYRGHGHLSHPQLMHMAVGLTLVFCCIFYRAAQLHRLYVIFHSKSRTPQCNATAGIPHPGEKATDIVYSPGCAASQYIMYDMPPFYRSLLHLIRSRWRRVGGACNPEIEQAKKHISSVTAIIKDRYLERQVGYIDH